MTFEAFYVVGSMEIQFSVFSPSLSPLCREGREKGGHAPTFKAVTEYTSYFVYKSIMLIKQPLGTRCCAKNVDINAITVLEMLGFRRLGDRGHAAGSGRVRFQYS